MITAADGYPLADLFWTFLEFFALIVYFWLIITVFGDLFRRHDVSGWGKAGWTILIVALPLFGVFVYLISQGQGMAERQVAAAEQAQTEVKDYVSSVAAEGTASEIAKAKELLDSGTIDAAEFDRLKASALA